VQPGPFANYVPRAAGHPRVFSTTEVITDGGGDRSQTVAALKIVLPRHLDVGYRFATP
jgi:hypothetical protein